MQRNGLKKFFKNYTLFGLASTTDDQIRRKYLRNAVTRTDFSCAPFFFLLCIFSHLKIKGQHKASCLLCVRASFQAQQNCTVAHGCCWRSLSMRDPYLDVIIYI